MAIEAMNDELTTLKKVLIAAAMLDGDQQVFTAEDVIVRAWRSFPESFGLSGYREEHPDSNRVLAKLMGSLGLCGRGWLEQTNTKTYRLTNAGRKMAKSLGWTPGVPFGAQSATKPVAPVVAVKEPVERAVAPAATAAKEAVLRAVAEPAERVAPAVARAVEKKDAHAKERLAASSLPSGRPATTAAPVASEPVPFDQAAMLSRIATSVASQKFARGGMITFDDACAFWGISRTSAGDVLVSRLEEFEDVLGRAEKHVRKTGAPVRANGRFEVTLTTVVGLQGLHRMLLQRYQRELDVIRARD
jgi:hypothetical protein